MKITVLGSGSRGNAITLETGGGTLLVDAGFGARTLARRLEHARVRPETIVGIALTHEHGDHARGARRFAREHGIPVYGSAGTLTRVFGRRPGVETTPLVPHAPQTIGPFIVRSCRTAHDASEPLAFAVEASRSRRRVGIAYDLGRATPALRGLLRGCHCLVVEANHDDGMLRTGPYPASVQQRIGGPAGHLSNAAAAELLAEMCHAALESIILVHVSDSCNEPALARQAVEYALASRRFEGRLLVARQHEPLPPVELAAREEQLVLDMSGPARRG